MSDSQDGVTQYTPVPPARPRQIGPGMDPRFVVSLAISAFCHRLCLSAGQGRRHQHDAGAADQDASSLTSSSIRWEPISRGDLVVFHYPYDPSKSYIKRVIGVAGDRVEIRQGWVYVNGELLFEPYVADKYRDDRSYPARIVPEDSYFMLGDHRNLSNDSRDFGAVRREYIYGKAVFAYWPADKLGKLR